MPRMIAGHQRVLAERIARRESLPFGASPVRFSVRCSVRFSVRFSVRCSEHASERAERRA